VTRVVRVLARLLYRVEIVGPVYPGPTVPGYTGPVVVAANHESVLDPPLLAAAWPWPLRFLAKEELWRHAPVARLMDALGGVPVRRGREGYVTIEAAVDLLRAGESVAVFPQGTVRGGAWSRGAARLALTVGAPLVPVRIIGSARALSRGRVGFPRIRIVVCDPILVDARRPTVAAARELTRELQRRVDAAR
jgi:1-acyl-sn-glycerol-3-phosphate acyltransferase